MISRSQKTLCVWEELLGNYNTVEKIIRKRYLYVFLF